MKKLIYIAIVCGVLFFVFGNRKTEIKNEGNPAYAVVVLGDSLSYGYGADKRQSYPQLLAKKINRPVINLGENGATAVSGLAKLHKALEQNPYMVLIEFGGNDFMHSVPFEETLEAVEQMVNGVQEAGAVAVIVDTGGYYGMSKYSKAYKKIAKKKGAIFVPAILDGIFGKRALMSDQIHPNAKGYSRIADKVYREIEEHLN